MVRLGFGPAVRTNLPSDQDLKYSKPALSEHTCLQHCAVHGFFQVELGSKKSKSFDL